jgi:hypothetical protein
MLPVTFKYVSYRKIYFLIILFYLSNLAFSQSLPKIRLDPSNSYGGLVSEYFTDIEYIPLETTSKSLFGDVAQLIASDSTIVVSDYDTRSVLFFDTKGKFLKKIQEKENIYPTIFYDKINKQIIISLYNSISGVSKAKIVSIWGDPITANRNNIFKTFDAQNIVAMGDGYYAIFNDCRSIKKGESDDGVVNLVELYKGEKLYNSFLTVNKKNEIGFCTLSGKIKPPQVVQNNLFYVSIPFKHIVYEVTTDMAKPVLQLIFPENRSYSTTLIQSNNKHVVDSLKERGVKDWRKIMDVNNIFFKNHLLFLKINPIVPVWFVGSEDFIQNNFIYDTVSRKLISLDRLTSDSSSFYLPCVGKDERRLSQEGLFFSNEYFYFNVSSLKMFKSKEETQSKNPKYPPVLQEYFKTQNRRSNPVIVKMKLKS